MMRTIVACIAALTAGVSGVAGAQFRPVGEYRESIDPAVQVSGLAVVGMAVSIDALDRNKNVIHVFMREPFTGHLRVEILSADGRFRGEGLYAGSTSGNTSIELSIAPRPEDKRARQLRPDSPNELAVAVHSVPAEEAANGTLQVASWSGEIPKDGLRRLRLHVNSRRADMFARVEGGPARRCEPLKLVSAVRFDAVCEIELAASKPNQRVDLIRRDGFDESTQRIVVP